MNKRLAKQNPKVPARQPRRAVRAAGPRPNRFHSFLRRLRAGGRNNMYGAIPYLMHTFALDREAAFRVVCEWVDLETEEASRAAGASPAR
jgi:hypothetical protein